MATKTNECANKGAKNQTWDSGVEFLMSCIAMSVGLGNVWRFPFTAYENGGGAFLLPYIVCLIIVGKPIYYLEMALGQFGSKDSINTYKTLAPALKGIGVAQVFATCAVSTYYCSLVAITLFYLYHSFTSDLPWGHCNPEWESERVKCVPALDGVKIESNCSISSSELWYTKEVMKQITKIDNGIGLPDSTLTIFLFACWLVLFILTIKGIKTSGKASYFLAIFPYFVMFALLIRSVTLEGSGNGILYFLYPQWDMLLKAKVWYNAVTQCFFSLGIGSGVLIMYASYNRFSHNVYRDALIITSIDTGTSILAGVTIFGILGNLAYNLDVQVNEVIAGGGAKLAFVSYPDAIVKFKVVPWLFAILFFIMLFVLGLGSLVALQGCMAAVLKNIFFSLKIWQSSLIICVFGFLISLVYVTPGGEFVLLTIDYFMGTFLPFATVIMEVVAFCWWYGVENLCADIEYMSKRKVGMYWKICWSFITPLSLIAIFLYCLYSIEPLKNGNYEIPITLLVIGWTLFGFGVLQPILHWIIYLYTNRNIGLKSAIKESFSLKSWRPSDTQICAEWNKVKMKRVEEIASRKQNWFLHKIHFIFNNNRY